jgi:hypothetical protein
MKRPCKTDETAALHRAADAAMSLYRLLVDLVGNADQVLNDVGRELDEWERTGSTPPRDAASLGICGDLMYKVVELRRLAVRDLEYCGHDLNAGLSGSQLWKSRRRPAARGELWRL